MNEHIGRWVPTPGRCCYSIWHANGIYSDEYHRVWRYSRYYDDPLEVCNGIKIVDHRNDGSLVSPYISMYGAGVTYIIGEFVTKNRPPDGEIVPDHGNLSVFTSLAYALLFLRNPRRDRDSLKIYRCKYTKYPYRYGLLSVDTGKMVTDFSTIISYHPPGPDIDVAVDIMLTEEIPVETWRSQLEYHREYGLPL